MVIEASNMLLEGELVKLRALEPLDIDVLYSWENNSMLWELSSTKTPFSKHILKQYIDTAHLDIYSTKQLRLVIENFNSDTVGLIDLFDIEPYHLRAGVGIYIHRNFETKGFASDALVILKKYSREILGLHQLYANIQVKNKKSLALFQKQGFIISGEKKDWIKTFEGWEDESLLQCIL